MFYDNYLKICNNRGIAPTTAALQIGFKRSAVTNWKKGGNPTDATIQKIADFFDVSVDYFLSGDEIKKEHAAKSDMPNDELKFALFGGTDVTDEQFEEVKRFAEFVRQRDKK